LNLGCCADVKQTGNHFPIGSDCIVQTLLETIAEGLASIEGRGGFDGAEFGA
jgi:hypothetical protein